MSPAEVTAGRAAIEHLKAAGGEFMDEPVLAAMTTHPRLLPVLLELMEGEPHLVSAGAPVKQPDSEGHGAAGRRPAGAAEMHCQREYNHNAAHFIVRPPGRIFADNLVCFPYFTTCDEGDGGLVVVPESHKSMFSRPRNLFGPHGLHDEIWHAQGWFGAGG